MKTLLVFLFFIGLTVDGLAQPPQKVIPLDLQGNLLSKAGVDVWIQDQDTPPFHYYLIREDKVDIKLIENIEVGDDSIVVSSGHGFTATGEFIVIQQGEAYLQFEVIAVSGDTIVMRTFSTNNYTKAAVVIRGSIEMNVDASTVSQDFIFWMRKGIPIDIQYVVITIWNNILPGDDGKFGDLDELLKGLRLYKDGPKLEGLGIYNTNSDFKEFGAQINYTKRSGGLGKDAVDITFDIKTVYGVVLRFDPDIDQKFIALVQDDLSDLSRLRIGVMGQYTLGE